MEGRKQNSKGLEKPQFSAPYTGWTRVVCPCTGCSGECHVVQALKLYVTPQCSKVSPFWQNSVPAQAENTAQRISAAKPLLFQALS